MNNLTIFFDADDVLVEATLPAIERYNAEYNKQLTFEQITDFGMVDCVEPGTSIEKYYDESGFYRTFLPISGMPEVIEQLAAAGHRMYVATSSPQTGIMDKIGCYEEHFPYFTWTKHNIIHIHHKHLLKGDVIVDDKIQNVMDSPCTLKLLVDKPWNQKPAEQLPGVIRVYSPKHILDEIKNYAKQQKRLVTPDTQYNYSPAYVDWNDQQLAFEVFAQSAHLPFVIGRDEGGNDRFADLSQMRNLLMVGEVASGKSNQLDLMIASMQHVHTSDQIKLLIVDPKTIEFSEYKNSEYLYRPIVTKKEEFHSLLQDLHKEIHRRMSIFTEAGVRSLDEYHQLPDDKVQQSLPYIVAIMDDMCTWLKENETIDFLLEAADQAYKVGIHFVATVISLHHVQGRLLSVFPSRFCFRTIGRVDMERTLMTNPISHVSLQGKGDGIAIWSHMPAFRFQGSRSHRMALAPYSCVAQSHESKDQEMSALNI